MIGARALFHFLAGMSTTFSVYTSPPNVSASEILPKR